MEYYPPVSEIPFAQIEWERLLPVPGQVLVQVGDRTEAMDIIARALRPGPMFAINAARALGIGNSVLPRYMVKREGEDVRKDEVLAARGGLFGLFRKTCASPVAGSILSIVHGRILLETEPMAIELRAYLRGEVVKVIPNYGAVIRTTGALVRGVWGTGKEAYGIARVVVDERDQPLTADLIDVSCHGAIVIGGSSVDQEALEQAAEINVRAVVTGGIDAQLMEFAGSLSFPVLVTQGLGELPMAASTFQLFWTHQGREAVIMEREAAWGTTRPEIVIALPMDRTTPPPIASQSVPLEVGSRVHITRSPYAGLIGKVTSSSEMMRDDETDIRFRGIRVTLDDGRNVQVPLANLDLIR